MKKIRVKFDNGEKWEIPLKFIAENRAKYYMGRAEEKGEDDFNYEEEIEFVMNDDYEGIDWAENNMNWEDVKDVTKKVSEPNQDDLQEQWCNAEKEIVDEKD
jgi:hypothetical protein